MWYIKERLIVAYILLIIAVIILTAIVLIRRGLLKIKIRRIPALNAIDDAVGRATEMGKPILYLTGLYDMNAIPTIAAINILSFVAQKTAQYEAALLVPCCRSLVMNSAREVVRETYIKAGKADLYNPENIKYLTDNQWGFVSGANGIMLREKPGACFYLGQFVSEALIYSEVGHSIGAIQIAGTNEFSQIPFFIVGCDYCLIGEELYAASAYFSKQPDDIGTLYGQDLCKIIIIITIIFGSACETIIKLWPGLSYNFFKFKELFVTQ